MDLAKLLSDVNSLQAQIADIKEAEANPHVTKKELYELIEFGISAQIKKDVATNQIAQPKVSEQLAEKYLKLNGELDWNKIYMGVIVVLAAGLAYVAFIM